MKKYNRFTAVILLLCFLCSGCAAKDSAPNPRESSSVESFGDGSRQDKKDSSEAFARQDEGSFSNSGSKRGEEGSSASAREQDKKDTSKEKREDSELTEKETDKQPLKEEQPAPALNPDTVVYSREDVVTTASVNIRKGPSTDSEIYQTAVRRTPFTRTADDGTWSAVQVGEEEYYIASAYLQLASEVTDNGYLVVIDAGHQAHGNSQQEPIGPGASETKAKVASGTSGCVTGLNEYELTLQVSLKLQEELEERGYQVLMVRTSHEVDISNSERAAIANEAGADAFIRVHANGSDDSGQNGILTICPTAENPYMGNLYSQCRNLSECVLDGAVHATGANKQYIWETDSMSGINWCTVPVTIVEMGFMTNPTEDANMADSGYQQKLAAGIADGVDAYFGM